MAKRRAPPLGTCATHWHGTVGGSAQNHRQQTGGLTMNILLLNPNTRADITDLMLKVGQRAAAPGTSLTPPHRAAWRALHIDARRSPDRRRGGAGNARGTPRGIRRRDHRGLRRPRPVCRRELFDIPIVGMAEAAMLTACMAGRRFGLVTFARALVPGSRNAFAPTDSGNAVPASACSMARSARSPRWGLKRRPSG